MTFKTEVISKIDHEIEHVERAKRAAAAVGVPEGALEGQVTHVVGALGAVRKDFEGLDEGVGPMLIISMLSKAQRTLVDNSMLQFLHSKTVPGANEGQAAQMFIGNLTVTVMLADIIQEMADEGVGK